MEETPLQPPQAEGCVNCGNPAILNQYPTKLCSECREKFIKYPIPKWIWAFAGGIALVVLIALFNLPHALGTGIAFAKGKKAEKDHRYLLAQQEFEKVVQKEPGYIEGQAHLMIAAF